MSKESFDRKLGEVEALRPVPEDAARTGLRRFLKDRSSYVTAKAAGIAGERQLRALTPDLLAAFDRFMIDPVKSDPQCWGKNALAKALKDLDHTGPAIFLRGIRHVQMEPVWGKREDTAGTLRGTCGMALIGCDLSSFEVLTHLTDLLNDAETPVRIDAARAIAQLSAREGAFPLRLKALAGDPAPEVIGHCLAALLSLGSREYLPFVAGFLASDIAERRLEAVGVLADSHEPAALDSLQKFWEVQTDPEEKRTILALLAGSPVQATAALLVSILESESDRTAAEAIRALSKSRFWSHWRARVSEIVEERGSGVLRRVFAEVA